MTVAARLGAITKQAIILVVQTLAILTEIAKIVATRADDALDDISGALSDKPPTP